MTGKLPFLLLIPHGGLDIPEELFGHENLSPLNIFFESDSGANAIFTQDGVVAGSVSSKISKLFVDLDREFRLVHPAADDGVIKFRTSMKREVFSRGSYPDEIAISNILKRYYLPYHESVRNAIKVNRFRAIILCHTHMAVGPEGSKDRGLPRPLVITSCVTETGTGPVRTAKENIATELASAAGELLAKEGETVTEIQRVSPERDNSFIMKNYAKSGIPLIRLSISRSLFLNEEYFDLERMVIDRRRLAAISSCISSALEKFHRRCF